MEPGYKVEALNDNKALIEKCLCRWGDFPAETLRDPAFQFFHVPHVDGVIGFKEELGCAATFGDPVCDTKDAPALAQAFHDYCKQKGLNVTYLISSEQFSRWAISNLCNVMIEVGQELTFDPQVDPLEGSRNKLRNKVNHAYHVGLSVEEFLGNDPELEKKIQAVGDQWLASRKGPQIYLANVNFFEDKKSRRWFYIKDQEGKIYGVALLVKLEKREGWYLKFLLTIPEAPRGTSECLMVAVLEALRKENCRLLTYGMVPTESLGELVGIGKWSSWMVKQLFKWAKRIFSLENRKAYWGQFLPKQQPSYILFEQPKLGLKEVRVVLRSLKVDI